MDIMMYLAIGIVGILMCVSLFFGLRDENIEYVGKVFEVLCPIFVVLVVIGYFVIVQGGF